LPELLLFDFLLRSENFKGSLKKENEVLGVFLFGLFIWPNWELGNQPLQAIFCTHAAAIVPPRSLELKLEAKEPSMEEAMRCELKLPVKRTAHIRGGGRVPTGALASRNPVEGDDRSPNPWAAVEDNDLYIWDEQPKERTPEGPNGDGNDGNESGNDNGGGDDGGDDGGDNGDEDPFGLHPMCCRTCRQSIGHLYTLVDECLQAMEAMKQRMEDLEHVVGDNFKFLNRNVRKLFGMVGNMRGKWCNTCLKYH
jgi:hypothetical protein